jgi:hypothetical protein
MIIARDKTLPKTEYKGHPCYAIDPTCPCKPCFNCHDCTPPNPAYSKKMYSDTFHCASNWNMGCPQPIPEPVHILNSKRNCKRCGTHVPKEK